MARPVQSNPITSSIDILFTILIFWSFGKWSEVNTLGARVLIVFLYIIIVNDWLSCRATFEFYTTEMFIIDVIIIFLFQRMVDSLTQSGSIAGYEIIFWLMLAFLSILYGVWDYIVSVYTKDPERKKGLRSWGNKMLATAAICLISYGSLYWLQLRFSYRSGMFLIAEVPPALIFVGLIILWNKEKFQLYKELERSFGKRKNEKIYDPNK